ncbi:DUF1396 domain-containing protein [Streptomyces griseocarneus]|nr:DUF1396 domain-containing protein [Streptomyces griseocarneus]
MRSTYRTTAGALLSVALLCGTAACSGGGEGKAAPKAGTSAEAKDSGRQGAGKPADAAAVAEVRNAASKAEEITSLSYTMSGRMPGTGTVEGKASMSMKPQALQMTMDVKGATADASGEMEMRVVDGAFYMRAADKGDAAAKWIKFDLKAMQDAQGGAGAGAKGGMGSEANRNPADDAAGMGAAKDLTKVGEETVDGVKTTHYTGTATLDQLRQDLKGKSPEVRERREKNLAELEKLGADKLEMDLWIDGKGHTKQFRTRSETRKGPYDMSMKFLDVNKPVTVQAPPADQVTDMAELARKLQEAKGAGQAA